MEQYWEIDELTKARFLELCKLAAEDDLVFNNFRKNQDIKCIIENSNERVAKLYIQEIKKNQEDLFNSKIFRFLESDSYGDPEIVSFDDISGLFMSPTTIRYIWILTLLSKHFNLDDYHIHEIGGGYGGQCKIIYDVYTPKSYTIYDLKEVNALQKRFLKQFDIDIKTLSEPKYSPLSNEKLLVAVCLWSELNIHLRIEYLVNVMSKCKNGFVYLNRDWDKNAEMIKLNIPFADFEIECIGPNPITENMILIWKSKK